MAITLDTVFSGSTAASTLTLNGTIGSGGNQILVVAVGLRSLVGTIAPTWNGVALTQVQAITEGTTECVSRIYRLLAPATGNHDLVITPSTGAAWISACVVSLLGVDQGTPENDGDTASSASSPISFGALTTTVDGCVVVDCVTTNDAAVTMTAETNRLERANIDPGGAGDRFGCSTILLKTTAGAVTMQWTTGGGLALAGQAFQPAFAGTPLSPLSLFDDINADQIRIMAG